MHVSVFVALFVHDFLRTSVSQLHSQELRSPRPRCDGKKRRVQRKSLLSLSLLRNVDAFKRTCLNSSAATKKLLQNTSGAEMKSLLAPQRSYLDAIWSRDEVSSGDRVSARKSNAEGTRKNGVNESKKDT